MKRVVSILIAAAALAVAGGASAQAQETGSVTVVHGVPGLTVDVYVNDEPTLRDFAPGTVTEALELPAGSYELAVREAGAAADSEPAINGSADLQAGGDVSIVAHLDAEGQPTLSVFANDTSRLAAGESRVSVRHTAAAPTVDVLANGEPLIQGLSNPEEQTANVPAGSYSVGVAPAGETDPVLGPADLALEEGAAYAVYAYGSLEDDSLDLIVQPIAAAAGSPSGVSAGTSGLVSDALPLWVAVLMTAGAAMLVASTFVLVRTRR